MVPQMIIWARTLRWNAIAVRGSPCVGATGARVSMLHSNPKGRGVLNVKTLSPHGQFSTSITVYSKGTSISISAQRREIAVSFGR